VLLYQPEPDDEEFFGSPAVRDLEEFRAAVDVIAANRMVTELRDVADKVDTPRPLRLGVT